MKTMQMHEAKATFSAVIKAAQKGESIIITKHGKPAAMVVPVEQGRKDSPQRNQSFIEHLMAFPGGIEFERNPSPSREVDL